MPSEMWLSGRTSGRRSCALIRLISAKNARQSSRIAVYTAKLAYTVTQITPVSRETRPMPTPQAEDFSNELHVGIAGVCPHASPPRCEEPSCNVCLLCNEGLAGIDCAKCGEHDERKNPLRKIPWLSSFFTLCVGINLLHANPIPQGGLISDDEPD